MTTETPLHIQFSQVAEQLKQDEADIYNRCAASLFWLDQYLDVSEWAYPEWSEENPVPDHFDSPEGLAAACAALRASNLTVSQIRKILTTLTTEDAERVSYAVEMDAGVCLAAEQHFAQHEDSDIGEVIDELREQADECPDCELVMHWLALSHITHYETMSSGLIGELAHNLSPEAKADVRRHLVVGLDGAYERALKAEGVD